MRPFPRPALVGSEHGRPLDGRLAETRLVKAGSDEEPAPVGGLWRRRQRRTEVEASAPERDQAAPPIEFEIDIVRVQGRRRRGGDRSERMPAEERHRAYHGPWRRSAPGFARRQALSEPL